MRMGIWTRRPQPLPPLPEEERGEIDLGEVSLFDLLRRPARARSCATTASTRRRSSSRGEAFSVRGQFDRLCAAARRRPPFDLIADLRALSCRAEAIAAFLAVLELARLNLSASTRPRAATSCSTAPRASWAIIDREAIGS